MSVTALPARTGRRTSHPAGPGRSSGTGRRAAPSAVPSVTTPAAAPPAATPSLTVTLAIPLSGDGLSPEAHRLIDVLRDLVERGNGTVTVADAPAAGVALPHPRTPETLAEETGAPAETAAPVADPSEVRLLAGSRQVLVGGVPLPMTRLEFDLLYFLAVNPCRVFTRVQLLAAVWGYEHTGERTVDVHVRRLRAKLGPAAPMVTTVYGVGYRLADDANVVIVGDA
jgi:two-component system, OmpR family, response regulator